MVDRPWSGIAGHSMIPPNNPFEMTTWTTMFGLRPILTCIDGTSRDWSNFDFVHHKSLPRRKKDSVSVFSHAHSSFLVAGVPILLLNPLILLVLFLEVFFNSHTIKKGIGMHEG